MNKILVVDGNSIINRAFYGIRPLTTKSGKHTNAIYGMINIISRQADAIKPTHIAVAFDLKAPTFRHKMYEHYKEGRHPTPPELLSQFDDAKECLRLLGYKVLELEGYEADDIQGTVAHFAHRYPDTESYILSGDRDLLQLIDDKITVLLASNTDTHPIKTPEFKEKYGVLPEQFVDMKALMGDSSDNIPGVMGIGEKTASCLIQSFGSLDGIYENIEDKRIAKGQREKLLRDKENAYLSKALAKIKTDVPLGMELADLEYIGMDKGGLYKKLSELELNSFIAKLKLSGEDAEKETIKERAPIEISKIDLEDLKRISAKKLAICKQELSIHLFDGEKSYVYENDIKSCFEILKNKELIVYDAKGLIHELYKMGIDYADELYFRDLLLYAYVINPGGGENRLSSLYAMFLNLSADENTPHPELLFELEQVLIKRIKDDGLELILNELELPLIGVLAKMEKRGFKVNKAGIREFSAALSELSDDLTARICMQAGKVFNINSPKQLGEVLFVDLGLPSEKKTKSGYSTSHETLEALRGAHPIIEDILEYRQVTKLNSTYALVLPEVADEGGRIHTEFKQALTATGRLSSADPNLQNIPIRTKMGREMRRFFVAEEGYTLIDADYSQIELRLLSHISADTNMQNAFKSGIDIHRATAANVFNVPEGFVTDEMRKHAKAVNFGIVYGIGAYSLSKDINTSVKEAKKYIENYLNSYPSVEEYLENTVKEAEEKGYTVTPLGRRRYIPELKSTNGMMRAFGKRVAMNAPIQGAAADIIKLAMVKVDKRLKDEGLDAYLVMQVHAELIVESKEDIKDYVKTLLKEEMENAFKASVPLTVDVSVGKNWLEQK